LPTSDVSLEGNITKQDFTRLLYSFTTKKFPDFVSLLTGYAQPITTPQTPTAQTATTPTTTLTNTSRTLKEVDGKAVSGTYILTFSGTTLSTQLCNVIGGEYTIQNNTIHGNFVQTEMLCLDEERNALENIFTLSGATFTIASTRMVDNNIQRLTITTPDNHTFTYLLNSSQNPEQAIGGQKDEHGCYLGAGYSWNEAAQECQRPREQKNATALDNTQWKLEKFNGKPLTGSYALSFDQGKLTAKFCNTLQGNYTLSGDSITGTLISTLVACTDDEPNTLEKGFTIDPGKWATLNDTLTITTSGDNIYTRKFSLK
jgi:heat shock protein HslJ